MKNLRTLKLDSNCLHELPNELEECKLMISLDLEGNKLKKLPSSLFTLERLEELLINSNLLT